MVLVKSESTVFPMELDISSDTVYIRENIKVETRKNMDGTTLDFYVYDEKQYTKQEYETMLINQNKADIDYLAIMGGIEL